MYLCCDLEERKQLGQLVSDRGWTEGWTRAQDEVNNNYCQLWTMQCYSSGAQEKKHGAILSRKGFLYGGTTTLPEHCDRILESRKDFKEIKEGKLKKREGWKTNRKYKKAPQHSFYMKMWIHELNSSGTNRSRGHFPSLDEFNPARCLQCFVTFL